MDKKTLQLAYKTYDLITSTTFTFRISCANTLTERNLFDHLLFKNPM
jgi:hypothetical protein